MRAPFFQKRARMRHCSSVRLRRQEPSEEARTNTYHFSLPRSHTSREAFRHCPFNPFHCPLTSRTRGGCKRRRQPGHHGGACTRHTRVVARKRVTSGKMSGGWQTVESDAACEDAFTFVIGELWANSTVHVGRVHVPARATGSKRRAI